MNRATPGISLSHRTTAAGVPRRLPRLAAALAVALAGAAGCESRQPVVAKPGWIGAPESAADPALAFAAVGQGGDPESARIEATRAVTAQVAAKVGSPGFDVTQYAQRLRAAGEDPSASVELLEPREFVAAAPAVNIGITQTARDDRTGRYAALASIDRASLARVYATQASANADAVGRLWNAASGQSAYQFTETLTTAEQAARARDALARGAQRIGESLPEQAGVTVYRPSLEEIRAAMAQASSPVSAGVFPESELPQALADEVRQSLFRLRVPQFTDRNRADIDIITRFTAEPANESATDARLVNWRLVLEPVTKTGTSLELLVLEGKTGGRSLGEARQEAGRLALIELRSRGDDFLRRVLYSQGNAPVLPPVITTTTTSTVTTTTTNTTTTSPTVTTTTTGQPTTTTTTTTTGQPPR